MIVTVVQPVNLKPAARWRLLVPTRRVSTQYMDLSEMVFRSRDGSDITAGGTPFASSFLNAGYVAAKAFDKDAGTIWHSGPEAVTSIGYAFAAPVLAASVDITAGAQANYLPKHYSIQRSDDAVTWETVLSVTDDLDWVERTTKTFAWALFANVAGVAKLANGDPAVAVIAAHVSGDFKTRAVVAADGSYSLAAPLGQVVVTAIGPAGYRPQSHLVTVQ